MLLNLLKEAKVKRVLNSVAAGTSPQTSGIVDLGELMADGAVFVLALGTVTSGSEVKLQVRGGSLSNGSDMEDLAGASVSHVADGTDGNNKLMAVEVFRPRHRYLRAVVTRAEENAVIDGVVALLHSPQEKPVEQDDDSVLGVTTVLSPAVAV